jgi:hypothetical protein
MTEDDSTCTVVVADLVAVLGGSIGDDKARRLVLDTLTELQVDTRRFTRAEALKVLETLAETPGIVGVASRFGRSRMMLRWARDDLRGPR